MTTRVYPTNNYGQLALLARGCAPTLAVQAHELGTIWLKTDDPSRVNVADAMGTRQQLLMESYSRAALAKGWGLGVRCISTEGCFASSGGGWPPLERLQACCLIVCWSS